MERRTFMQVSAATVASAVPVLGADPVPTTREWYELRTYTLKPEKLPLLDGYLKGAFLPALKKIGVGPVGVFTETESSEREVLSGKNTTTTPEKGTQRVTVLIVHKTPETITSLPAKLAGDEAYREAAADFLAAKADDPVYQGLVTSLLGAIAGMPKLENPDSAKPRLLNLRIYQSHNERAAAKKVEMFEKGEIDIFRRVGLTPVFFASALAGPLLPNLTYMLTFPDEPARAAAWGKFVKDSEWTKLKGTPGYADKEILSRITNRILTPHSYSEI